MAATNDLLIDVRSPAEFATGSLRSGALTAVNIEYQLIDQLADIYLLRGIHVRKSDNITLYCRSGRRSNIALQALRELGYSNVRDIGGLEEAGEVLKREEEGIREVQKDYDSSTVPLDGRGEKHSAANRDARANSFGKLLEGLKGLE